MILGKVKSEIGAERFCEFEYFHQTVCARLIVIHYEVRLRNYLNLRPN